ncbi:MAG: PIN domain-containing protein [Mesorhizobium sp.]|nr:PIN domain-containing protein [Mesorhizobium sp.]
MYLVDTNIVSQSDPRKSARARELIKWMDTASPYLFLSAVTASEVMAGISKANRTGATTRAAALTEWWEQIEALYGDRILVYDIAVARAAGAMFDRSRAFNPGFADIAIGATAKVHGLTVLTANEAHFIPLGVAFINPLKDLPPLPGA